MTYTIARIRTTASVRAEIANSPRSMRATVLGCMPWTDDNTEVA